MERIGAILIVSCLYQAAAAALQGTEKYSAEWVFLIMLPLGIPIGLFYALPLIIFAERMQLTEQGRSGVLIAVGVLVAITAAIFTAPHIEAWWIAIKFGPIYLLACYIAALRATGSPSRG